jgi:membrane protein
MPRSGTATVGGGRERFATGTILSLALVAIGWRAMRGDPNGAGRSRSAEPAHRGNASDGRGRSADGPHEIPAAGWRDILLRVYAAITEDRVLAVAAGVTFYGLLAMFPAVAALVSSYALFADPATIHEHLNLIAGFVPEQAMQVIADQITRIASQQGGKLGLGFIIGLAVSLWSANAGMKAIFDALNVVYDEREKRGFIRLNAITLVFTAGAVTVFLLAIAALVVLPIVLNYLPVPGGADLLTRILRWPALLLAVAVGLAVIYRYGPSRERPRWRWVTPGSAAASAIWLIGSLAFSWYASNLGNFDKTYGSLGAVVAFLMWMWLSAIVVLLGAELDAEMEHQTARDSTDGSPKPMGARGAKMADTIGASQG